MYAADASNRLDADRICLHLRRSQRSQRRYLGRFTLKRLDVFAERYVGSRLEDLWQWQLIGHSSEDILGGLLAGQVSNLKSAVPMDARRT